MELRLYFLKPKLTFYDSRKLLNLTITDTMDEWNPMHVQLNGQAKMDPLVIENFYKPLCTRKILIEVCVMPEEDQIETMQVTMELD